MKRVISVFLSVIMMISFVACGEKEDLATKKQDETSSITQSQSITSNESNDNVVNSNEKKEEEKSKTYEDIEVLYDINSNGDAEVVGYIGDGNQITISSEYEGADVVRIADSAFENCTMLESIILWAEIEEIGNSAFKGCTGLKEFSVPSDTEIIGHNAFQGCTNLETLIMWGDPDIGEYAFADCSKLTEISIGSDTKNVGAHAFENCTGVTSLIIWGAEIIGDYAFAGCTSIEDVSIPSETLSIGYHAFDGCTALKSVIVWGDETAIGEDAFVNCPNLSDVPLSRGEVLECTINGVENTEEDKDIETSISVENEDIEQIVEGIRPEFQQAMDSYESFYNEYCDVLEEYMENPSDLNLLTKYSDLMLKAEEVDKAFEEWNEEDMTNEELQYYLEVSSRIMQRLVEVSN